MHVLNRRVVVMLATVIVTLVGFTGQASAQCRGGAQRSGATLRTQPSLPGGMSSRSYPTMLALQQQALLRAALLQQQQYALRVALLQQQYAQLLAAAQQQQRQLAVGP